jgi:hypothetical protein
MYYIQNKTTGQPAYYGSRGVVDKCYSLRILAETDAEKAGQATHLKTARIDVVEISKSARLYMENQHAPQPTRKEKRK